MTSRAPGRTARSLGTGVTIEGIVVGDYQATPAEFGGFYLQEETADADADPSTSEGIFVFDDGFGVDVHPGDRRPRARHASPSSSSLTEIDAVSGVVVCSTGQPAAAGRVGQPAGRRRSRTSRRFEGMLVHFDQTLTATEVFNLGRFGEVSLSGAGRLYTRTAIADARAPATGRGRPEQPQPDHPR